LTTHLIGFVGHLTDAIDQILAEVRMFAGVDHQYAIVGDQKNRVGAGVVKEKVELACDLLTTGGLEEREVASCAEDETASIAAVTTTAAKVRRLKTVRRFARRSALARR
jgi:hypothetical protein